MAKENKKKYYLYQMDIEKINLLSIIILGVISVISYFLIVGLNMSFSDFFGINSIILLITLLGYLIIHELLHSLAYVIYGAKFKNIIYGIELEKGILYCLCKQNITRNNILHSLLYPFFFIGVVTYIISLIFNIPLLMVLSILNISGCAGDFAMFYFISRLPKDVEFSELDDSTSFAIYTDKDIEKIKSFGINFISDCESIERNDFEKVKISKKSKTVLIVIVILLCLLVALR